MSRYRIQWVIEEKDHDKLVKDFLKEQEISKRALAAIKFKGGSILLNEKPVTVRKSLETGDKLMVEFPEETRSEGMIAEQIPLDIIYEDPYIFIINKPQGMNTIPSREHPVGSLANGIAGYYEGSGYQSTVHIVTRLDRDTSGIVLVAKHRHIHHLFSEQQKKSLINRTYEAIASGIFNEVKGTIQKNIRRKMDSIIEREVHPEGQYACTHFDVIHQYPSFALVKLKLETGRTHQIRVHLASIGHPLLGDDLYGGPVKLIKRQALHCRYLQFFHPILQKEFHFEAPLPEDLQKLLNGEAGK